MGATTDAHAHVIVPELLRGTGGEDWRPRVWRQDGTQVVELEGREIRSMVGEAVDIEAILADREALGIERVLLCPWVPLLYPGVEAKACLERCRIQNAALAALVGAGSGRVAALGAVPLQDPELAAAELRALRREGGLAGVEVGASIGGAYLGDGRFEPFWEAAEESGSLVFVHPTTRGFSAPVFDGSYLWNTVGNPFETTIAAAQMTMAGLLERRPGLRVLLAHGGGALPALRGRLDHAHGFQPDAAAQLTEPPSEGIRRFYLDTVTHDRTLLAQLIEWVGAERILLGSDFPFDMADPDPVATVRSLGLDAAAERAVLAENAARLLDP